MRFRRWPVLALAAVLVSTAAPPVASEQAASAAGPDGAGLTLDKEYVDRVLHALRQRDDHWGEKLLRMPDGPTAEAMKALLVPAMHGGPTTAESQWHYLPLTYPAPDPASFSAERDFSIHFADGGEIMAQWADGREVQHLTFFVGAEADERFGSAEARLATPELDAGYRPILINTYTDGAGVRFTKEQFVTRLTDDGPLVSMVEVTANAADSGVERTAVTLNVEGAGANGSLDGRRVVDDGKTVLASSSDMRWSAPRARVELDLTGGAASTYFVIPNAPGALPENVSTGQELFEEARGSTRTYWDRLLRQGARVDVPEEYAADAMRNLLIQNLVMGFNLTIGNGYEGTTEDFAFVPEVAATVTSLGDFGYEERFKANVIELMDRGQGSSFATAWEHSIKMQTVATYYLRTGDASLVESYLPRFKNYLAEFARQRDADPNGLLEKARYASDIIRPVYGIHHQAEAWRAMRDIGVVLRLMGRDAEAAPFTQEAADFRTTLLAAVEDSATMLEDGSIFVPIELLDPQAPDPFDSAARTFAGGYWNLIVHYALATGIMPPGSELAEGLKEYLYRHGTLFLGLTRFNLTESDPGVCQEGRFHQWPADPPGYKASGVDEQYGYSRIRFLADNHESDRLLLNFYGKLTQDLTTNTFTGGEGTTIAPCPYLGEYYRTQYWPPLSPNNAVYLEALRSMLLHEDLDTAGVPSHLHIAPSTPRSWLNDGEHFGVTEMPTAFGPLTYSVRSRLDVGMVDVTLTVPPQAEGMPTPEAVTLHLRAPAGHQLSAATVNGRAAVVDPENETIDIGAPARTVHVQATFRAIPDQPVAQAEVFVDESKRHLVQPGGQLVLDGTLETLGTDEVAGTLDVELPESWSVPIVSKPFNTTSNGRFVWESMPLTIDVPADAAPGESVVSLIARPVGGEPTTVEVPVTVAAPSSLSYADLVLSHGPVGFWRMGPADDGQLTDASGHGNDGRFIGNVVSGADGAITDDADTAVRFEGGHAEVPDSASLSVTGPYTVEAWIRTDTGAPRNIVEKYDTPANNGYLLRMLDGAKLSVANLSADAYRPTSGTTSIQPGVWHHLVSVYDGDHLRLYIDGREDASLELTVDPSDGSESLKLGARGDDALATFTGWMDEVAIYDHALTVAEIDSHYARAVLGGPVN